MRSSEKGGGDLLAKFSNFRERWLSPVIQVSRISSLFLAKAYTFWFFTLTPRGEAVITFVHYCKASAKIIILKMSSLLVRNFSASVITGATGPWARSRACRWRMTTWGGWISGSMLSQKWTPFTANKLVLMIWRGHIYDLWLNQDRLLNIL